jgi:hypothetical protein
MYIINIPEYISVCLHTFTCKHSLYVHIYLCMCRDVLICPQSQSVVIVASIPSSAPTPKMCLCVNFTPSLTVCVCIPHGVYGPLRSICQELISLRNIALNSLQLYWLDGLPLKAVLLLVHCVHTLSVLYSMSLCDCIAEDCVCVCVCVCAQ